jgi:hypothetical protein
MPTLNAGVSLDCFKLSLLLAALSYLLVPGVGYYKKNGLKTHGQAYFFAMEEVILRPGEEDDFLETVPEKVELVEEVVLRLHARSAKTKSTTGSIPTPNCMWAPWQTRLGLQAAKQSPFSMWMECALGAIG